MAAPRAVCPLAALPPGERKFLEVDDRPLAILNVDGELHAIENVCPHRGGPVGEGMLDGHILTCPWHDWSFDIRSGQNTMNPAAVIRTYPCRAEGDQVVVEI
jgi:nitrite reductase/ring-hydroxylating ferredoxin subunit